MASRSLRYASKHALEQQRPDDAARRGLGMLDCAIGGGCAIACLVWLHRPLRHHPCPQLRIRRQQAMEADQVLPRPRHQHRQPLQRSRRAPFLASNPSRMMPALLRAPRQANPRRYARAR